MELREHPRLSFRDGRAWPPTWMKMHEGGAKNREILEGEIGLLKDVLYYPNQPSHLFLIMGHEGSEYMSCISLSDPPSGEKIARILQRYCGLSMELIGSLNVSENLEL